MLSKISYIILKKPLSLKDNNNDPHDEILSKILGNMQDCTKNIHEYQEKLNTMTSYLINVRHSTENKYQDKTSGLISLKEHLNNTMLPTIQSIMNELEQDITWLSIQEKKTLVEVSINLIPAYINLKIKIDDAIQRFRPYETAVVS